MKQSLRIQHELLLMHLQAQRLVMSGEAAADDAGEVTYPRSTIMRFFLRRPQLSLWLVQEGVPFILSRVMGSRRRHRRELRRLRDKF